MPMVVNFIKALACKLSCKYLLPRGVVVYVKVPHTTTVLQTHDCVLAHKLTPLPCPPLSKTMCVFKRKLKRKEKVTDRPLHALILFVSDR